MVDLFEEPRAERVGNLEYGTQDPLGQIVKC